MHKATTPDSFWAKVDKSGTCWIWTGSINNVGYGQTKVNGRAIGAHRLAYEYTYGPVSPGLVVDHLCKERACCNPGHLQAVTQRENIRRGVSPVAKQMGPPQSHCRNGHEYTPVNTGFRQRPGKIASRVCITCRRNRTK